MEQRSRDLARALLGFLLLALFAVASPPFFAVSEARGASALPSLHRLHFVYDKTTGQRLEDPTAVLSSADVTVRETEALLARKRQEVDPTRITFRSGITMHPEAGMEAGVRETLSAPDGPSLDRMWLIQFRYPFPTEARPRLEDAGVAFYDYVDVSGFFARTPPGALPLLDEMLAKGVVRYVGSIPAEAKVQQALATEAARRPESEQEVVVLTFDELASAQLAELERLMAIEGQSSGPIHFVEGTARGASLRALAELDFVRWVEERTQAELGNLDGGMGVGGDVVRAAGYDGSGVQVMVVDSGIARQGDAYHPDLQADRVFDQYDYQADDEDATDDWVLKGGHGTHVAGTIGGRYNGADPSSNQSCQGLAPDADLLIYRLFGLDKPFDVAWFQEALLRATSGGRTAHVSNNSWGRGDYGEYDITSEFADAAVQGEYNGHPVNIVAAAMNDSNLVRSPGTGKSVITVGAVKDGNYPNTPFTYACGSSGEIDWPPGERVCYSNYGPIDTDGDGQMRIKPDLAAPGAMITSAVPWYLYPDERYYSTMHGTSMATPHVTGAIAQLLEAYPSTKDWPEMVKAMLLAAAVDVGGDTDYYGHGMLDAYHAILPEPGVDEPMEVWGSSVSATRETRDFTFDVPEDYEEVRVVLTWADPPGAMESINDLDVWVWDGNGALAGWADSQDDTVEYVKIEGGHATGTWKVGVAAESVTDLQPFALAAHVILADAALSIEARPASVPGMVPSFMAGGEFYLHQYVSNSGYTAGGSFAKLHAAAGFTVTGVTIFTGDGYEHWYAADELYHDPEVPNDWYVAVGDTIASSDRHVRWSIEIGEGMECASYPFQSTAYWLEAGEQQSSATETIPIPVACHLIYLPVVLRGG